MENSSHWKFNVHLNKALNSLTLHCRLMKIMIGYLYSWVISLCLSPRDLDVCLNDIIKQIYRFPRKTTNDFNILGYEITGSISQCSVSVKNALRTVRNVVVDFVHFSHLLISSGSSGRVGEGPRNMKSIRPPSVAMALLYAPPPDPTYCFLGLGGRKVKIMAMWLY